MKLKIKIYYIFLCILFTGISCKKELETAPDTSLQKLSTFLDIKAALGGVYDGFQSINYYQCNAASGDPCGWSALPDLMGDDFVESLESLGNWRTMSEMTYASDNGTVGAIFFQPYEIASRANNILQSLAQYETGDTEAEAKRIKAQVLAIRGHVHFDLLRYFGQNFERNSDLLGVPYVKVFDPLNPLKNLPTRATVKSNYDEILADLNESLINFRLADDNPDNEARIYIDSITVHAMMARINYYASQWNDVITHTSIALQARYLTDADGYAAMFTTATEPTPVDEIYWAIPSDGTFRPGRATNGPDPNYRLSVEMSNKILALGGAYTARSVTRFDQLGFGEFNRTLAWKYPGIRSFKVFRAGEMMLMRAEAKQRINDPSALDDLNALRTNRDVATGSETGEALLTAIQELRRVELLGEGHRWFDLKRTTRTINRVECGTDNASTSNICTVAPGSRSWVFPIPFNDIRVNPNLTQNAGY